ncbi:hypothetical protein TNCV_1061151 [Trichonephila clavipes]|nr:hypothetical protein TNCV_1061151 [Trichonephila clavipes]
MLFLHITRSSRRLRSFSPSRSGQHMKSVVFFRFFLSALVSIQSRFYRPKTMPLLSSRGRSTTHPSLSHIGRALKVFTRPSDSLMSYSRGPNNNTRWPVLNDLVSGVHLYIWIFVNHAAIVFLKSFSSHQPMRQCSKSEGLHPLSPCGALLCPL